MAKKKDSKNYLDYIPQRNPAYPWTENEDGIITITVEHKGFYNRLAQKFFHTPAQSRIDLDRYGSFIWKQIDDNRNLFAVSELLRAEYGKEAEPLYNRMIRFFEILKDNRFIIWKGSIK